MALKTVQVVAALIINQDKVFATQQGYGEFKDGWEFPGGKIEPGETPEQALKREIQEEYPGGAATHYGGIRLSHFPSLHAVFSLQGGEGQLDIAGTRSGPVAFLQ